MTTGAPADFLERARALGLRPTEAQVTVLSRFVGLLLEANAQFNLTAIRSPEQAWSRHILDSLSLLPHLELPVGGTMVDVGAGGGLPGIPLAIMGPDHPVTLVDATEKKTRYLAATAAALGLEHVEVVRGRAEDLTGAYPGADGGHRERYDVAVARALAPMPVLLELVSPFLKPGGRLLAIKGERAPEELAASTRALRTLHMQLAGERRTPTGTVLILQKTAPTAARYPRRPGEPKRAPL